MSLKVLISIIVTIAAIYWMFTLARQPGGGLMYLTIFSIVMSLLSFYAAFFNQFRGLERLVMAGNSPVAAGFFLVMAIGTAYISYHQRHGPDMIAKWITVYPKISDITAAPPLKHDFIWSFIVKCDAKVDKVSAYYEDPAHTKGWTVLVDSKSYFEFKKPGYRLFLLITPDDFGDKSSVQYQLEDRQHHMFAKFQQ